MDETLHFYCPAPDFVASAPSDLGDYWGWVTAMLERSGVRLGNGEYCDWHGPFSWTIQTHLQLRAHGIGTTLVSAVPESGVVLSHSDFWIGVPPARAGQHFVEIKPDRSPVLEAPLLTICQSAFDPLLEDASAPRDRVAWVPYWPQPSLVPRGAGRPPQVTRAAFLGNERNLLDVRGRERLTEGLDRLGVRFATIPRSGWHDYSELDVVIAVREGAADGAMSQVTDPRAKPATKLVNAWLAGVPAILSPDPSYLAIAEPGIEFLAAESADEILDAVRAVQRDVGLWRILVERGRRRAEDFDADAVRRAWQDLIEHRILPLARETSTAG